MGKAEKIGIMGGTFNPIHNGHLLLAEEAREQLQLDKIIFMPSGQSYMKRADAIVSGEYRAHMVELAISGNSHFQLSKMELERSGPTYTCDTLKQLKIKMPKNELFFIMGADSLLSIDHWKDPDYIFQNCTVIAAVRSSSSEEKLKSTAVQLREKYQADIFLLSTRYIDISSTEIRRNFSENKSVRYMLPENVYKYINENHIY